MELNNLKQNSANKDRKRVGRGGKRGTYSGRGNKGQRSRSGTQKIQPIIRELIKRYPKLRGYRHNFKEANFATVSLTLLEKNFKTGDKVSPQILLKKGIISKIRGKMPQVKVLANGEIKKKVIIEQCLVSKQAQGKIEKAGGKVKLTN